MAKQVRRRRESQWMRAASVKGELNPLLRLLHKHRRLTHHADSYADQAPGDERMRTDRLQWRRIEGGRMAYRTLLQVQEGRGNPA